MSTAIIAVADRDVEATTDAVPEPEQEWYFTFGYGQRAHSHGSRVGHDLEAEGFRLDDRYVKILGTHETARAEMVRMFGQVWSQEYDAEEGARVAEAWSLTELVVTSDWRPGGVR